MIVRFEIYYKASKRTAAFRLLWYSKLSQNHNVYYFYNNDNYLNYNNYNDFSITYTKTSSFW